MVQVRGVSTRSGCDEGEFYVSGFEKKSRCKEKMSEDEKEVWQCRDRLHNRKLFMLLHFSYIVLCHEDKHCDERILATLLGKKRRLYRKGNRLNGRSARPPPHTHIQRRKETAILKQTCSHTGYQFITFRIVKRKYNGFYALLLFD